MTLAEKYRPRSLDQIIGQDKTKAILRAKLRGPSMPQEFLFTGPNGVGKTSLAYIVARESGCDEIVMIDAASNSGVDHMRRRVDEMKCAFCEKKALIVDECNYLTDEAWAVLQIPIENPFRHQCWIFCGTDLTKIPASLRAQPVDATPFILIDRGREVQGLSATWLTKIRGRTSPSERDQETALVVTSIDLTSTCCCAS